MNAVAGGNEPAPVLVMLVVSPVEVRIAVRVDIREVGVAVRIDPRSIYSATSVPLPVECSPSCIVFRVKNSLAPNTK